MKQWLLRFIMIASLFMQWAHGLADHLYSEKRAFSEQSGSFLGRPTGVTSEGYLHQSSDCDEKIFCVSDHGYQLESDPGLQLAAILPEVPQSLSARHFQEQRYTVPVNIKAPLSRFYNTSPLRGPPCS